ncbi:hypothetical protein MKX01_010832 [Papaver californicum]|nr:hypothetical protein MKX01_010832 [Papaver californicum]
MTLKTTANKVLLLGTYLLQCVMKLKIAASNDPFQLLIFHMGSVAIHGCLLDEILSCLIMNQTHEVVEPIDVSPEVDHRGCSQEATNSPLDADSSQPPRKKNTRGITTLPNVALRDTAEDKLKVKVSDNGLVGTFSLECTLAIGMWVRQSDNFPLDVRLFRNMPEEKIARVSKLVRVILNSPFLFFFSSSMEFFNH